MRLFIWNNVYQWFLIFWVLGPFESLTVDPLLKTLYIHTCIEYFTWISWDLLTSGEDSSTIDMGESQEESSGMALLFQNSLRPVSLLTVPNVKFQGYTSMRWILGSNYFLPLFLTPSNGSLLWPYDRITCGDFKNPNVCPKPHSRSIKSEFLEGGSKTSIVFKAPRWFGY